MCSRTCIHTSHWLKGLVCVLSSHPIHACARGCLISFFLSLYFFSKFLFHLFLIPAMVPDENSMNNPLCNSAIGSMVTFDYVTPDTYTMQCNHPSQRCISSTQMTDNIFEIETTKNPVLSLSAVTDEEDHPLENDDESGRRLCEYWETIFQARVEGPRHHQHEDILRYVQEAPNPLDFLTRPSLTTSLL